MNIISFLRLVRKHIVLLLVTPLLMAILVIIFTRNPNFTFSSETTLYTGIASGSSVEMDKSFSYFANNTAFDNLINVVSSRETQQEVAIRLLAQHLMLSQPTPGLINRKSFDYIRKLTPSYVNKLVVRSKSSKNIPVNTNDTSKTTDNNDATFSFSKLYGTSEQEKKLSNSIDLSAFEKTVENLTKLLTSNDTNFVYQLLNYDNIHYSLKEISTASAIRIGSSDLVKLKYTTDDPGICQQTLIFLTEVSIKNYKNIKENRSDAVLKYFEYQVTQATRRLKMSEDKLLSFNMGNNIINYYEQSKAVAIAKEQLDVDYNNMKIKFAGIEASIKRLEEKLQDQQIILIKSAPILEKRNKLSLINTKIATIETMGLGSNVDSKDLTSLKIESENLKEDIRKSIEDLYSLSSTSDGVPISSLLNEWITNVLNYEDTKAGLTVLAKRIEDFQKQYEVFAPAGANLTRIEREISVSEQEYLELLRGLNLAKLKMQDIELSSNLKIVDQPYYPLTPNPTKRKILVIVAALLGFLAVITTILALEYFDETLRNPIKAIKELQLSLLGIFPKVYLKPGILNFDFVTHRLLEMMVQQIELLKKGKQEEGKPFKIVLFSTSYKEGKTIITRNLASKLKSTGKKVIIVRYTEDAFSDKMEQIIGSKALSSRERRSKKIKKPSLINWILGYPDDRVNYQSPFLETHGSLLNEEEYFYYRTNADYLSVTNYKELLTICDHTLTSDPDYILIEIPSILYYPFPAELLSSADLQLMVCRSNRVWTQADQGAVDNIIKTTSQSPHFVLNGVEMEVVELILGELPKERSWFRRIIKKMVRFQFFESNFS